MAQVGLCKLKKKTTAAVQNIKHQLWTVSDTNRKESKEVGYPTKSLTMFRFVSLSKLHLARVLRSIVWILGFALGNRRGKRRLFPEGALLRTFREIFRVRVVGNNALPCCHCGLTRPQRRSPRAPTMCASRSENAGKCRPL